MMDANAYTKMVLSLILVCLVLLVAGGFQGGPDAEVGRYQFVMHKLRRGGPLLLRHDTATGEGWGLRGFGGSTPLWVPIHEASGMPEADDGQTPGD